MAEFTFYPDADPGDTSVDGYVYHDEANLTWLALRGAAGTAAVSSTTVMSLNRYQCGSAANRYNRIFRCIILFDTSELPDDCVILSATLSLYGSVKVDNTGAKPNVNIYTSNPANDNALQASDYAQVGSVPLCDTPIGYDAFSLVGYNDFLLNAAGILAINKTGISKFGTRSANYDVPGIAPAWLTFPATSYLRAHSADAVEGLWPKLFIVTEEPAGWTGDIAGVTDPASIMGIDVAGIETVKGVVSS